MKLNLGSGTLQMSGFVNVDHRSNTKADIVDDAFELRTIKPGTVTELVASHILEHACYDRTKQILKRWLEVLCPGGKLWLALPDFRKVLNEHAIALRDGKITWAYYNSRIFGNANTAHGMYGDGMVPDVPGIHKYELAFHRAVFTPKTLLQLLRCTGYVKAKLLDKLPFKFKHPDEFCVIGEHP
jgi:hypothetical protein